MSKIKIMRGNLLIKHGFSVAVDGVEITSNL